MMKEDLDNQIKNKLKKQYEEKLKEEEENKKCQFWFIKNT